MGIALIAAMADDRVIGIDNRLPWRLPADLQHFKGLTLGKPVVMGRLTWESLGRPLPGRRNIVITGDMSYRAAGAEVVHSPEAALAAAGAVEEVMVIGGASIYAQFLPRAQRMYLTFVHGRFAGDAWFPAWNPGEWRETGRVEHAADERNPHPHAFVILDRVTG